MTQVAEPIFHASENPNPILRANAHGVLLYANPAAERLLAAWQIAVGDTLPEVALHALNATLHTRHASELEIVAKQHFFLLHFKVSGDAHAVDIYGFDSTLHKQLVMIDPVTQFPNRFYFRKLVEKTLEEKPQQECALLLVDIADLSTLRQNLGIAITDALMHACAKRVQAIVKDDVIFGNMSYRELAILLHLGDDHDLSVIIKNLLDKLSKPYRIKQRHLIIQPSIGVAIYTKDTSEVAALFRYAELALGKAKVNPSYVQYYRRYMDAINKARFRVEKELQHAISRQQFREYYQPQINAKVGLVVGAESLIRWNHPQHGLLTPNHFMHYIEELGWISQVSQWMLNAVCNQAVSWKKQGLTSLNFAVNISPLLFVNPQFVETIVEILNETKLDPQQLELEITETTLINDFKSTVKILKRMRDLGVNIALDDFGTKYSSLNYLQQLPLTKLKIDRSFVNEIKDIHTPTPIIDAIIKLGHDLNLTVVAEGIEKSEQINYLLHHGCDLLQGHYYSAPLSAADFAAYLNRTPQMSHL